MSISNIWCIVPEQTLYSVKEGHLHSEFRSENQKKKNFQRLDGVLCGVRVTQHRSKMSASFFQIYWDLMWSYSNSFRVIIIFQSYIYIYIYMFQSFPSKMVSTIHYFFYIIHYFQLKFFQKCIETYFVS